MNDISIPRELSELIGVTVAEVGSRFPDFIRDRFKSDREHLLASASGFNDRARVWIMEDDLPAVEGEAQARPWCVMLRSKPLANFSEFLKRNLMDFPQDSNSAKPNNIPE
ncbi:MAG: hypothetical protein ABI625_00245 [bacterium]